MTIVGKHRQSGELQLGRERGRGLRSVRVQAMLGRRNGWEDEPADGPNRASAVFALKCLKRWSLYLTKQPFIDCDNWELDTRCRDFMILILYLFLFYSCGLISVPVPVPV